MQGGSTLGIGITMFLRDQFSGPAAKITNAAKTAKKSVDELFNEQLQYTRNLSGGLAMAGAGMVIGLSRAVKEGAKFGYEMAFLKNVTAASNRETKTLVNTAQSLGKQYMFSSAEVTEGMKEMGKAGMTVQETIANIQAAIQLAGSTYSELGGKGGAADIMVSVMKQWSLGFEKSAAVADLLSYAVNASTVDVADLAEALKYAGSTAKDTGVTLDETTAMIMALGNAGMKGSMAGVAVENALRYMGRAMGKYGTGQQRQALQEIGMSLQDVQDQAGNMRPMVDVFTNLGNAIDKSFGPGMGLAKQDVLNAIFGVRGKRSASLLLRNLKEFKSFVSDINTKAPGNAAKVTADMMDTLHGRILQVGHTWQVVRDNFATAMGPILKPFLGLVKVIGDVLGKLLKIPILGNALAGAVFGFIVIKTVSFAFKAILSGILLITRQMDGAMTLFTTKSILGWNRMTNAARAYSTQAGYSSIAATLAGSRRSTVGVNAAGKFYEKSTGKFVSQAAAKKAAGMMGGGILAGVAGKAVAGKVGGSIAAGMLGKVVGFLGGPLGIALSFIIPGLLSMLFGAINKNRSATEANTNALGENGGDMLSGHSSAGGYMAAVEFLNSNQPQIETLRAMGATKINEGQLGDNFIKSLSDQLSKITTTGTAPVNITINLDGRPFQKIALDLIKKQQLITEIR